MARSAAEVRPITADELFRMPDDGLRRELVRGEVRTMTPAGYDHGKIAMRLGARLLLHVEENGLGDVLTAEPGFRISTDPDTVLVPDVAFVRRERAEEVGGTSGFWPGAPDLVVEVISPSDTYTAVEGKVFDWLSAGCRMVIVVNPRKRTATVYRSLTDIVVLLEDAEMDGGDVVPGWRLPVRYLFS